MIDPTAKPVLAPISFSANGVIFLCEGPDECHVLRHLLNENPDVHLGTSSPGVSLENELLAIVVEVERAPIRSIGFFFDEEEGTSEFESAYGDFQTRYGTAETENCGDLAAGSGRCRYEYFRTPKCLESLFVPQLREDILDCARSFIACHQVPTTTQAQQDKQLIRTYLAALDRKNTTIGVALKEGHLTLDSTEFDGIREFVARVLKG